MKKIIILLILLFGINFYAFSQKLDKNTNNYKNNLSSNKNNSLYPYPLPKKNIKRYVINLAKQKDEGLFKIEIIPTKKGMVDCNHSWYGGKAEIKSIGGWGYSYIEISNVSDRMASTLMGCPDKKPIQKDVIIHNDLGIIKYNSKLPVVIYVPKDVKIQYRIWKAGKLNNNIHLIQK